MISKQDVGSLEVYLYFFLSDEQYVLRDAAKNTSVKDKSTYILVPKRDDEQLPDKAVTLVPAAGTEELVEESGMAGKWNSQVFSDLTFFLHPVYDI